MNRAATNAMASKALSVSMPIAASIREGRFVSAAERGEEWERGPIWKREARAVSLDRSKAVSSRPPLSNWIRYKPGRPNQIF